MKNIRGFWLPDGDTYFIDKPNYEVKETNVALNHVKQFRTAIDVGAHCGFWTQRLSKKFKNVVSLEPVKEHFDCLEKNTRNCKNTRLINAAASNYHTTLNIETFTENSGKSRIIDKGDKTINSITIDSLKLKDVDFIKIDVEGHERNVILGATQTIETYHPILFVEINEKYNDMKKVLTSMGYENILKIKFNYIWKFKK